MSLIGSVGRTQFGGEHSSIKHREHEIKQLEEEIDIRQKKLTRMRRELKELRKRFNNIDDSE